MNSIRKTIVVVTSLAALGIAPAFAGISGKVYEELRNRGNAQPAQSQPAAAQAPQRQNGQPDRQSRPPQQQAQGQSRPPQLQAQGSRPQQQGAQGGQGQRERNGLSPNRSGRGVIGGSIDRNYGNNNNGGPGRGDAHGNRPDRGGSYNNRPPRYVSSLPRGYRNYNWNGRPYYSYRGSWYRPYGSSYISIGVPYGLFVSTLPGYSNSFWYGNSRYYYYDDNYYVYEPDRRGYVVTRSPYGDEPAESADTEAQDELFIYPAKGQSEQQQSDDRYECHRWAADETHYDPIDDTYDADQHAGYLRAMTACLTGRGYSVR